MSLVTPITHGSSRKVAFSWGMVLIWRCLICITLGLLHFATESYTFVLIMVALALYSAKSISAGSPIKLAISIVLIFHIFWILVAMAADNLGLMTVNYTPTRWLVFSTNNLEQAVMSGAQLAYILTLCLNRIPEGADFRYSRSPRSLIVIIPLVFLSSFVINGTSFSIAGGYGGNTNIYWSGLPAIFVTFCAAWILNYKKTSIFFFISTNAVVLYWLSTGNRSEVLAFFIYVNIFYLISWGIFRSERSKNIAAIVIFLGSFFLFSAVGIIRSGGIADQPLFSMIFGGLIQEERLSVSTVGSSIYSSIVAIEVAKSAGYFWGSTFLGQLQNTIPSFIPTPWDRYIDSSLQMMRGYQVMGGAGILGEAYMNFGRAGAIIIGVIFACILRISILSASRSFLSSWFLLTLCLYSPRFFYYGYVYLHNLILLFIFIWIATIFLRKMTRAH